MNRGYATRISIENYCNFNPEKRKSRRLDTSCSGGFQSAEIMKHRRRSAVGTADFFYAQHIKIQVNKNEPWLRHSKG